MCEFLGMQELHGEETRREGGAVWYLGEIKTRMQPRLGGAQIKVVVQGPTHRLRVVLEHFPGLFLGALLLHALPLQVSLLGLLENLISSPVSPEKLVRLLGGQRNYKRRGHIPENTQVHVQQRESIIKKKKERESEKKKQKKTL